MWERQKRRFATVLAVILGVSSLGGCLADGTSLRHPFGGATANHTTHEKPQTVDQWIGGKRPQ